jgi:rhodanese-related sulfurtransferase
MMRPQTTNPHLGPVRVCGPVRTIAREELCWMLHQSRAFKLVMCLDEWAFLAKHIPGSIHFHTPAKMLAGLGKDEEIVLYCSNRASLASLAVYWRLVEHGHTNVRRYPGGLSDWEAAGLPLEGDDWVVGPPAIEASQPALRGRASLA